VKIFLPFLAEICVYMAKNRPCSCIIDISLYKCANGFVQNIERGINPLTISLKRAKINKSPEERERR